MRTLLLLSLVVYVSVGRPNIPPADPNNPKSCPDKWFQYRESCYLIMKDPASLDQADEFCGYLHTTLFVPNTKQEFDYVAFKCPVGDTWMGIFKSDDQVRDNDIWQVREGINPHQLAWKDGDDNGWSPIARCGALTKTYENIQFMSFYPCYSAFTFICERNATFYIQ